MFDDFIDFAQGNPDKVFLVTEIGCGLAGYNSYQISPLFAKCIDLENVYLPEMFYYFICLKNGMEPQ